MLHTGLTAVRRKALIIIESPLAPSRKAVQSNLNLRLTFFDAGEMSNKVCDSNFAKFHEVDDSSSMWKR
jgi:hypothetical protein